MSWVLHSAGLSVEELGRNHVQLLGRGCRPTTPQKSDSGGPQQGTVVDAQGDWWELGDRARHFDSASRQDLRGRGAAATATHTSKFHLGVVQSCADAAGRTMLLPDLMEARGRLDDPRAVCASGVPPGLPLVPSEPKETPAQLGGRRPTYQRGEVRSRIETRVADAHHSVQRRTRSSGSEHFTLVVPCCRVYLGRDSNDEWPATDPQQWPAFITSVVLGGRVDGVVQKRRTLDKDGRKKGGSTKIQGREHVKWSTSQGEVLMLDFHNGPVSRAPKGSGLSIADFLAHLDDHWVKKARLFPATWSLLWVETLDTEFVLSELRGLGIRKKCPFCSAQLVFGAAQDEHAEMQPSASDDEDDVKGMARCASASSGSGSDDEVLLLMDRQTPGSRMSESSKRWSTRVVKRLFKKTEAQITGPSMRMSSSKASTTSAALKEERRIKAQSNQSNQSDQSSGNVASAGSLEPQGNFLPADMAQGAPGVLVDPMDDPFRAADDREEIKAWGAGSLPCSRCHSDTEPALHALICPKVAPSHSYLKPLCIECREALECVLEMQDRNDAEGISEQGDGEACDAKDAKPEPIAARFNTPARPALAADSGVLSLGKELFVAIEIELRLSIETVNPSRHQLLLDELRDELHRALTVPMRQILILQDNPSLKKGVFQIGILHPVLVPLQAQRSRVQDQLELKSSSKETEQDAEALPEIDLEMLDAAEDLGRIWDRLVLFLYGGAAQHRTGILNSFPLLRSRTRDASALRWRSATVVPLHAGKDLIEAMHTGGGDDDVGADSLSEGDSDLEDTLSVREASQREEDPKAKKRQTAFQMQRRTSQSRRISAELDSPTSELMDDERSFGAVKSIMSLRQGHQSPEQDRGDECSKLRPPNLGELLTTMSAQSHHDPVVQVEHTWRKRFAERYWNHDAQELGLLPPLSEVKVTHMPNLHWLAWNDDLEGLTSALSQAKSATLHEVDRKGRTAMHLAAARCSVESMNLFASIAEPNGPLNPDLYDEKGRAPIHYAAYRGDASIVSCFIRILQTRSLDAKETLTGDCPVLLAARAMHEDVLYVLICASASLNTANNRGLTPLHAAVAAGSTDCCSLLLRAQAEPKNRDALDRTPLDWAVIYSNTDVADLIRNHKPKMTPLKELRKKVQPKSQARSKLRRMDTPAVGRNWDCDMPKEAQSQPTDMSSPKSQPHTPRRPGTTGTTGRFYRRKDLRVQQAKTSDMPEVRVSTAPVSRSSVRTALLDGCGVPQENWANLGVDGWTGNAGSLAVRWRSWAEGAFPDRPQAGWGYDSGASQVSAAVLSARRTNRQKLVCQFLENPTRGQVAETAEAMGAFFCPTCWEYVLEGHPSH